MKHLAMAVVVKKDKVLVQKCYHADKGMMAQFPGGRVNFDESGTDAAIRELAQETGITGLSHTATYTKENDIGGRTYFVILRADESVEPASFDMHQKSHFDWLSTKEIPEAPFYSVEREFVNQYVSALA